MSTKTNHPDEQGKSHKNGHKENKSDPNGKRNEHPKSPQKNKHAKESGEQNHNDIEEDNES